MWARIVSVVIGLWLMVSPAILRMSRAANDNFRIVGPLVISASVVAMWGATRGLRWLNVPLGAWLLVAPWLFHFGTAALVTSLAAGVLLIGLAFAAGEVEAAFGGGWSALFH